MTFDIDKYYSVRVSHGKKIGPRLYRAEADIIRRDTNDRVGKVSAEGGAMTSADHNALAEAKRLISKLGTPKDWHDKT